MTTYENVLMIITGGTAIVMIISIIVSLFCHVDETHIETNKQFFKDNRVLCITTGIMTTSLVVIALSVIALGFLHVFVK